MSCRSDPTGIDREDFALPQAASDWGQALPLVGCFLRISHAQTLLLIVPERRLSVVKLAASVELVRV